MVSTVFKFTIYRYLSVYKWYIVILHRLHKQAEGGVEAASQHTLSSLTNGFAIRSCLQSSNVLPHNYKGSGGLSHKVQWSGHTRVHHLLWRVGGPAFIADSTGV
ncbi:hypothetical protein Pcinc_043279 [Petrolisthes cinctipes]|uniref:Uncharacterized protein n=1 Tax=Petrolisthes cinctipes TaxID=88211 RepID=A0AAE1EF76_PETCI|nr:hypothetical protein Pcinc_043279 [Petrolisthes cinctipes]